MLNTLISPNGLHNQPPVSIWLHISNENAHPKQSEEYCAMQRLWPIHHVADNTLICAWANCINQKWGSVQYWFENYWLNKVKLGNLHNLHLVCRTWLQQALQQSWDIATPFAGWAPPWGFDKTHLLCLTTDLLWAYMLSTNSKRHLTTALLWAHMLSTNSKKMG